MIDGISDPDGFLLHATKATGSLMLIRVYMSADGVLKAHWAGGEMDLATVDPLEVVRLAHATTGCQAGRRIDPDSGDDAALIAAWDAGYQAARRYQDTKESLRTENSGLVATEPDNPYRPQPLWDF